MIVLDCQQQTPEWYAVRRGIPTASEFSKIITNSAKASASQEAYIGVLIDELVHPDEQETFDGNKHTERGNELEPQGRDWYRFVTGADVRQVGFILRDDRLVGCSPDSLVGTDGGLEIKAPERKKHVMWSIGKELPDEHKAQVHGCMVVTGAAYWDFVSYCPGYKPFMVRTVRDKFTAALDAELINFIAKLEAAKAEFADYLPQRAAA